MDEVKPERNVIVRQEQSSTGFELTEYRPPLHVFPEDRLVFHPERERSRRSRDPVLLLEDGLDGDEEQKSEGSDGPPSPKRARIDEDTLIAEAVLAYTASIVEGTDTPTTYAQAMASSEAAKWCDAMKAELLSHERNGTWTLVPRGPEKRAIGCR
ncbi:polyprotein [Phytophthora megakarya]|uniref:Polyprotein n=1 Tax=Phytophthora megakarya TaxID=4795 RepID=A0A225UPY6_9STRA|nr:polyprotein [Phytophthora megakarya]